jgi:hypothetical protein
MRDFHLEIDISCDAQKIQFHPTYRLYVDDTLITERTYIWGSTHFIREHIFVKLSDGSHCVRIEVPKNMEHEPSPFNIHRVIYDGAPLSFIKGTIHIS